MALSSLRSRSTRCAWPARTARRRSHEHPAAADAAQPDAAGGRDLGVRVGGAARAVRRPRHAGARHPRRRRRCRRAADRSATMPLDWLAARRRRCSPACSAARIARRCAAASPPASRCGQRERLVDRALQPNLGRVAGYTLAGALAGGLGHGIVERRAHAGLDRRFARGWSASVLVVAALRLLDRSGRLRFLRVPGAGRLAALAAVATAPAAGQHRGQAHRAGHAVGLDAVRAQHARCWPRRGCRPSAWQRRADDGRRSAWARCR